MQQYIKIFLWITGALTCLYALQGCKKFLDKKQNAKDVIPTTIKDLQSLLDNSTRVNDRDPSAGERSSDDYYSNYSDWASLPETERRVYTWEKDNLFLTGIGTEWPLIYENVYRANVVLDIIDIIERSAGDQQEWNTTKGHALFIRARSFLLVVTTWALAYDERTASTDMGIPLRLDVNFNTVSVRASVKESYERVIMDLKEAAVLSPVIPLHMLRPSKPAVYALLARTYLLMQKYDSAMRYADLCLQLKNNLLDYNTVNASLSFPFAPRFSNPEIIFESQMSTTSGISYLKAKTDSFLYQSYATNDLRKTVFFVNNNNGSYGMKGNYTGSAPLSTCLATDEVYLMRSECRARSGDMAGALTDLNALLSKRWKTGFFQPVTATNANDALNKILVERRKELLMRGIRWMDIKRLNVEGRGIGLTRRLNNDVYTLAPNSLRFALPIPDDVIQISGMPQNPR